MSRAKIYAMIPARMGSNRLKKKNLALINGRPMVSYAINAALESKQFDRVIVNSEDEAFREIAREYGAEFYHRPKALGSSETKSDDVVADFIKAHFEAELVAWVNPTSPLQTGAEILSVVDSFLKEGLDSLITVEKKQVHCLYEGRPLNFSIDDQFAKTQDLEAVYPFVYSVMMWRSSVFLSSYQEKGSALFCGNFGTFAVSKLSSLIIKTEEDLRLVDAVARGLQAIGQSPLTYDKLAEKI